MLALLLPACKRQPSILQGNDCYSQTVRQRVYNPVKMANSLVVTSIQAGRLLDICCRSTMLRRSSGMTTVDVQQREGHSSNVTGCRQDQGIRAYGTLTVQQPIFITLD